MRIDGNEIADYLARESTSYPLRGPEHALGISAKVARRVTEDRTNRKHEEHLQSICEQRQAKGFS